MHLLLSDLAETANMAAEGCWPLGWDRQWDSVLCHMGQCGHPMGSHMYHGTLGRDGQWDSVLCHTGQCGHPMHGVPHVPWDTGMGWRVGQCAMPYGTVWTSHAWGPTCTMGHWDGMESGTVCYAIRDSVDIPCMGSHMYHGTLGRDGEWDSVLWDSVDIPWGPTCTIGHWDGMDSGTVCYAIRDSVDIPWGPTCTMGHWDGMESGTVCYAIRDSVDIPCMGSHMYHGTLGRDGEWDSVLWDSVDIPWGPTCTIGHWDGMDSGTVDSGRPMDPTCTMGHWDGMDSGTVCYAIRDSGFPMDPACAPYVQRYTEAHARFNPDRQIEWV